MTERMIETPVHRPTSTAEALALLSAPGTEVLAGATWAMRDDGAPPGGYVAIASLDELQRITHSDGELTVGSAVTHASLARTDLPAAAAALAQAAAASAFTAIRTVATVGGNVAARSFAEADLVPALIALDAIATVASGDGEHRLPVARLREHGCAPGELITHFTIPTPAGRRSAFQRLTIRGGAEYAVVSVAVSVDLEGSTVTSARVAIGAAEAQPRLCARAAEALVGGTLGERAPAAAAALVAELSPRTDHAAPGWYRSEVSGHLLGRVLSQLRTGANH